MCDDVSGVEKELVSHYTMQVKIQQKKIFVIAI